MKVIYGPPGTGKTSYLIQRLEEELAAGVDPRAVAFVSFTTAAVNEALSRATTRFGLGERDLPYFKTLHAIAYAEVGAARNTVMSTYDRFARDVGLRIQSRADAELTFGQHSADDVLLRAHQLCVATRLPLAEVARAYALKVSPERFAAFREKLTEWKRDNGQQEYADLLDGFLEQQRALPVEVAFVDEAQDLTPHQWQVVEQAFAAARETYVAGDDDQAIYHWAGADPAHMLRLRGEARVLEQSHRLPHAIKSLTARIGDRIRIRQPKHWRSAEHDGELRIGAALHSLDFGAAGSWMLLGRTAYALQPFCEQLTAAGILYTLNGVAAVTEAELDCYRTLHTLRTGGAVGAVELKRMLMKGAWADQRLLFRNSELVTRERLRAEVLEHDELVLRDIPQARLRYLRRVALRGEWTPRVSVSTIHQAKGAEADHVVLAPAMSRATADTLRSRAHADDEHRVWYVGASRARRTLTVLRNEGEFSYRMA